MDLWRPDSRLTWRKLGALVRSLPPESATATALRVAAPEGEGGGGLEPDEVPWSQTDQLLATVIDVLRRIEHLYVCAHVQNPPSPPEPLPRPGVRRRKRKQMTVEMYRKLTGQDPPERLVNRGARGGS